MKSGVKNSVRVRDSLKGFSNKKMSILASIRTKLQNEKLLAEKYKRLAERPKYYNLRFFRPKSLEKKYGC